MFCRFLFIFTCFVFLFFPYRISAQADDFLLNEVSVRNNTVNIVFGRKKGLPKPKTMILNGATSSTEKLVLDFPETELKAENIKGKLLLDSENSQIRMSQFSESPKITRIVIEASPEQIQKYKLNFASSNLKVSFASAGRSVSKTKSSKTKNTNSDSLAKTNKLNFITASTWDADKKQLILKSENKLTYKIQGQNQPSSNNSKKEDKKKLVIIELPNAALQNISLTKRLSAAETGSELISLVQFDPETVRITLEGTAAENWYLDNNQSELELILSKKENNLISQIEKPKSNTNNNKEKSTIQSEKKLAIENNGRKIIIKNPDQNIKYKIFHLDSPSRLVIDLLNFEKEDESENNLNLPEIKPSPENLLISLRKGKLEKDLKSIRLVFDLSQKKIDFKHELSTDKKTLFVNLNPIEKLTVAEKQIKNKTINRKQYKVVIDAGHGGYDAGAIYDGIEEKTITLAIAKNLEKNLKKYRIQTVQTREDDRFVSLDERVNIARQVKPDLFVSIHCNALQTSSDVKGIESYYFTPQSQEFTESLHKNLVNSTKAPNRYVRKARFVVIRETAVPSTLIETGYLSNKNEREKLSSQKYQEKLAEALGEAINTYLKDSSQKLNK